MQENRPSGVLFRPTPEPSAVVPVGARSVGWRTLTQGECCDATPRPIVTIHWGIEGTGVIDIRGVEHYIQPGQIGIYLPDMMQRMHPADMKWTFRWWTLDGPFALSITAGFGFSAGVFDVGPAPINLFNKLENAIRDVSRRGEVQASAVAYELLCHAAAGGRPKGQGEEVKIKIVLEQIHKNWNNPQLSISVLSAHVGLHPSSLSRLFTKIMHMNPTSYIKNLRIQNALTLLKETDKTVAEISLLCGYNDPNYFCRLIRRSYSMSPRECRKLRT